MMSSPRNDSGGAGGLSTGRDYLRFAQMLANGGVLDGQRVLSRTTVRLMTSDHLGSRILPAPTPGGAIIGAASYTFGLGFAVRPSDGLAPVPGSAGDFYWGGYAGTFFWVDPKEQLAAVFMVQSAGTATSTASSSTRRSSTDVAIRARGSCETGSSSRGSVQRRASAGGAPAPRRPAVAHIYLMGEKAVGRRIMLRTCCTIGPFFSLSANTRARSGSLANPSNLAMRSSRLSQASR